MFQDYREPAAQLAPLGSAQALYFLGKVLPVERQISANPGRFPQSTRLLLGPADEVLFIKLRGAAGHILSQIPKPFLR
jgi:hypothetical protein